MSLTVNAKSASSLPNVEKFGLSDPYAVFTFQNKKQKTQVIQNNLDPEWNETFTWSLSVALVPSDQLQVEVYDHEKIGRKRLLGKTTIPLHQLSRSGKLDSNFPLTGKDGSPTTGKISLTLVYQAPAGAANVAPSGSSTSGVVGGGGADGDGDGDLGEEEGGEATAEDGEEGGDAEAGGGTEGGAAGPGAAGPTAAKRTAKKKAQRKATRANLPNKPTDFQVRVHVIEARKLPGANLKPVVKVQCGTVVQGTSVQKGTNNPIFDQVLIFTMNERPAIFLDNVIDIKVLNSKKLLKDALIGSFKFDVGLVYDEPGHAFIHKWLLLTDPDDVTSEAKGYLKISINVLGPGDEPTPSPTTLDDEDVDIEANLLRPSGVRLQAATMTVKIYRAEDLPQMDGEFLMKLGKLFGKEDQKELVDPYCVVSYAGHSGRTPTVNETMNPEWNTQINLGVRMPSMCERLRITLKDYDRVSRDDYIGTGFIRMSEISVPGENGFLPTFGPAFVNIYGSPREFSNLPDKYEYLNMGKIEGVAYRGRVMVEVGVNIGEFPTSKKDDIKSSDLESILPFLRRRKYKLYAAFMHATAIKPADKPVAFEVSIGNYGNKLDNMVPDASSTTQSSNPVYDGNHYHYLPWFDTKPCVQVESHWEDNTYRIGSLNILRFICQQLEAGLGKCRAIMAHKTYDLAELKFEAAETLGNLITHLGQPLPKLPEKNFTHLDVKLRKLREEERVFLVAEARALRPLLVQPEQVVEELDGILQQLRNIAYEPQITVPDVVIWMLSGKTRVAYKRIPAYKLMYASQYIERGELCGTIQTIMLEPPAVEKEEDLEDAVGQAQLRLVLWLGLESDAARWSENIPDGQVAVYAETYEHQASLLGKWGTTALVVKNFSDTKGKRKLDKDDFIAPEGWAWDEDWFVNPEISAEFEADSGRKEYQEELYECQFRLPFTSFERAESCWRDAANADLEKGITKDTLPLRKGWQWISEWKIDLNRAVDDHGWQFSIDADEGAWAACERTIHVVRRRRWVRTRQRLEDTKKEEKKLLQREKSISEGWEYARTVFSTYHVSEHKLDFARRRRWHRKLVQVSGGKPPVFYFESEKKQKKKKKDDDEDDYTQAPRIYLTFPQDACHRYQLRAYIYQARDMHGSDESGLSDPYATVSISRYSHTTRVVEQSVCPTWDQTIILDDILLFGNPDGILQSPPICTVEFYDKDLIGKDEYLGITTATPLVRLDIKATTQPRLQWYNITRYTKYAGELLAVFELLFLEDGDLPFPPPKAPKGDHFQVPAGIRPVLQKTRIEVLCWGVRDMKKYQLLPVNSPLVELECGGYVKRTDAIKSAKENPNFPNPVVIMDVNIPKEPLYAPPLNIRIMDKRAFGRKPAVAMHIVKSLRDFHCDPGTEARAFANAAKAVMTQMATMKRMSVLTEVHVPTLSPQTPTSTKPEESPLTSPKPTPTESPRPSSVASASQRPASTTHPEPPTIFPEPSTASPGPSTKDGTPGKQDGHPDEVVTVGILPKPAVDEVAIRMEDEALIVGADPDVTKDSDFDWWSKFYASIGDEQRRQPEYEEEGNDKMVVYGNPLETFFGNFEDIATTYPLFRGKGQRDDDDIAEQTVGKLKGAIKVCPFPIDGSEPPQMFGNIPPTQPVECIVRVYIVRALDLQAKDPNGKSDPFVKLSIGKKKINDQDNYIPNNLNPIFGRLYELPANLPIDHTLTVTVMDYDRTSANDLIGVTTIDLENRYLTKYKALCGLPETFSIRGLNNWRNTQLPRDLLNEFCLARGLPDPRWNGTDELIISTKLYKLSDFEPNGPPHNDVGPEDQRLALHVLRQQGLVPEHVETRPLFNELQPDVEQGRIQMWVDIFPKVVGVPPAPVDITPRKPKKYTLRVVVHNTKDVELDEISIATGEAMSDIYVKGWLQGLDETQKTDVHYRSLDGEGNFNWRLLFPFEYLTQEKVMVVRKKEHFYSLDTTERRLPPRLTIQVWDNDLFNPDDFIGTIDLKLDQIPKAMTYPERCSLEQLLDWNPKAKSDDLFKKKRIKGWWPVYSDKFGKENREMKGKVELELEVVTEAEELERPAGKAREEPNMNPFLPEPNRPATSFLWFTSPWKTFKMIIWKHYKWHIIGTIIGILLVLILAIVIYTLPNQLGQWLMSSLLPGGL